jgi:hypothetical protein
MTDLPPYQDSARHYTAEAFALLHGSIVRFGIHIHRRSAVLNAVRVDDWDYLWDMLTGTYSGWRKIETCPRKQER